MSKFIMVKAKNTLPSLKYLEESYNSDGEKRHFNIISDTDKAAVRALSVESYPVYILVFSEVDENKNIEYLYLGKGVKCESGSRLSLKVSISQKISNQSDT